MEDTEILGHEDHEDHQVRNGEATPWLPFVIFVIFVAKSSVSLRGQELRDSPWRYNARTCGFFTRNHTATTLRSTPFTVSTAGALVVLASQPPTRLPSGMPPRNATM